MEKPLWPIQNLWPLGAHLHKPHVTTNHRILSEERTSSQLSVRLLTLSYLPQLSCRTRSKKCIRVTSKSSHFDSFPLKIWPVYSNSLSGATILILPGKLHTTLQILKNWNKKIPQHPLMNFLRERVGSTYVTTTVKVILHRCDLIAVATVLWCRAAILEVPFIV